MSLVPAGDRYVGAAREPCVWLESSGGCAVAISRAVTGKEPMTYLITGATGDIGSRVVRRLLERAARPRIFVRDAEKARARFGDRVDIHTGDLGNAMTMTTALERADVLLLINSGPDLAAQDEAAAEVARVAGVRRLVKLSSFDARENIGTGVWHSRGEAAIRTNGIPFTFVQPSGFMTNALLWATSIKSEGVVRASTGDGRIPFIHPEDIAEVITAVLTSRGYEGQSLAITGPEALSYAEMIQKIGDAIGKAPLAFQPTSEEHGRQQQISSGAAEAVVEAHVSIFRAIREGRLAEVTDTVERVLDRKPITFDQWVRENASAFRS